MFCASLGVRSTDRVQFFVRIERCCFVDSVTVGLSVSVTGISSQIHALRRSPCAVVVDLSCPRGLKMVLNVIDRLQSADVFCAVII